MNNQFTSEKEKSMYAMIEFLHKKIKDSQGKVIGHNECKIPGIVEITYGENGIGYPQIDIDFEDGTTWYFDCSNSQVDEETA